MRGSESSRPAANYKAYRALFLLLQSAAYQSISLPVASRAEAAPITRINCRVSDADLRTLIDLGLVEMRDDVPVLTNAGHAALD